MSESLIAIKLKIEKLEEGNYLATSETLQGLVAQGRTVAETMEIAQDVARKLIESCIEYCDPLPFEIGTEPELELEIEPSRKIIQEVKIPINVPV